MKFKAVIFAGLFALMTTAAFAQIIPARVNVTVLSGQITAHVINPFPQPIICNGQVFGQTIAGPVLTTFFHEQVILPGSDRIAFVVAHPVNPFISGRADVHCRFAVYGWGW